MSSIFVITAPSGTGKTTLNRRLVQEIPQLEISISHTTRQKREKEIHGDHYWFVTEEEFQKEIQHHSMLEWAQVFGNYYGTSQKEIHRILEKGSKVLLEIDVQGWDQVHQKLKAAKGIFILPPSIAILWQRLTDRGTDHFGTRLKRIKTARSELEHAYKYDYFILNDDLDLAFDELKDVINCQGTGRLNYEKGIKIVDELKKEYDTAPWIRELFTQS